MNSIVLTLVFHHILNAECSIDQKWDTYKLQNGKAYETTKEHERRKAIFKANLATIKEINTQNLGYTIGINKFADKTLEESLRYHTGLKPKTDKKVKELKSKGQKHNLTANTSLPSSYGSILNKSSNEYV
jgi:hypothetical protein